MRRAELRGAKGNEREADGSAGWSVGLQQLSLAGTGGAVAEEGRLL